jgi:hypothetical protein
MKRFGYQVTPVQRQHNSVGGGAGEKILDRGVFLGLRHPGLFF